MKILTAAQIREIDRLSTEEYGIPSVLLMENAGMRVMEALEERFEDLDSLTIAILCGKGNNGGDGFVVARQLLQKGCYPFVFFLGDSKDVQGDALVNMKILEGMGAPPTIIATEEDWMQERLEIVDADIVVDAIFGTGLTKPVDGLHRRVIESLEEEFLNATIVSIDVPSGLPADSAHPLGPAVHADVTVTFTALKPCLVLPPNHKHAGDVIVADIGNPDELLEDDQFQLNLITFDSFPSAHHRRLENSNKGDYGKVLVIGGSHGKAGAAAMAGQAALRSGAGLVTVATTESALPMVAMTMPELMTEPLQEPIEKLMEGKTILAIGPGLGTHPDTKALVRAVVRNAKIPVVVDADGLNAFAGVADELANGIVITPHPGEMARLIGKDVEHVQMYRLDVAREFATSHNVYVVLKGFRSVIATPDGAVFINPTGNPGMATAGAGDILTGMIAGILGQEHLGSFIERLCLAVYLHGLAGDLCAEEIGEEAMVATDILQFLGGAWKELRE